MNKEKQISNLLKKANELASELVEELARKILVSRPHLGEFVMGMGIAMFTVKSTGESISLEERSYMKKLNDFIDKYDDELQITGESMRFTASGPKIVEW